MRSNKCVQAHWLTSLPLVKDGIVRYSQWLARQFATIHQNESGQLSVITLLVLLGFVLLIAGLFNIAVMTQQKIELQNAADAVAQASTTKMARGMNAVTAANHTIGEMQALVVLHQALGGKALDENNQSDLTDGSLRGQLNGAIQLALQECLISRPPTQDFIRQVTSPISVEGAIGESQDHLKRVGRSACHMHALGAFLADKMGNVPIIGPIARAVGMILVQISLDYERQVVMEWRTLKSMETLAKAPLLPAKKTLQSLIVAVHQLSRQYASETPDRMEETAEIVGDEHGADATLFPGKRLQPSDPELVLPVHAEPETMTREELPKSQLVRASTPWIQYWRLPLLELGSDSLRLARFQPFYVQFTQEETLNQARRAKRSGVNLLILPNYDPRAQHKGSEPWTRPNGSRLADKHFGVMSITHRPAPLMMGAAYFPKVLPDGMAAYTQGMIYNANPQQPDFSDEQHQSEVGFDTLNWLGGSTPEWELGNDPHPDGHTSFSYFRQRAISPRVKLNWQSQLVPTTRISEAVDATTGSVRRLFRKLPTDLPITRTH